jgi:UDP-glucuronate 4-epimerase
LIETDSPILVTGAAGFIGFHLSKRLLEEGFQVVGIDNMNDYYSVALKRSRNDILKSHSGYTFVEGDIADRELLPQIFEKFRFDYVINLAAQAGVRYSLINPFAYTESNITGFVNILEQCKTYPVKHLVYASSSSVYGANTKMPFSAEEPVNHPLSLYAATKKANELIAHSYSSSFDIPTTGLRFFTAYGPWGRPDMALFLFTEAIIKGKPIDVYNNGEMIRDFTYVDDIIESVFRLIGHEARANPSWSSDDPIPDSSYAPYRLFNVGNNQPVKLMDFIAAIESSLGKKAEINFLPLQMGDVPQTYAKVDPLLDLTGFKPSTSVSEGIEAFISWYNSYFDAK